MEKDKSETMKYVKAYFEARKRRNKDTNENKIDWIWNKDNRGDGICKSAQ